MKSLTFQILNHIQSQPAHHFPIIFTPDSSLLSECSESSFEIFQEVLTMERQGLIEAYLIRDVVNRVIRAEVSYITLQGRIELNPQLGKNHTSASARMSTSVRMSLALILLGFVALLLFVLADARFPKKSLHPTLPPPLKPPSLRNQ